MSPRSTGRPGPADPAQRDAGNPSPSVGERPTAALAPGRSGVMMPTIVTTMTSTTGTASTATATAAAAVRAGAGCPGCGHPWAQHSGRACSAEGWASWVSRPCSCRAFPVGGWAWPVDGVTDCAGCEHARAAHPDGGPCLVAAGDERDDCRCARLVVGGAEVAR